MASWQCRRSQAEYVPPAKLQRSLQRESSNHPTRTGVGHYEIPRVLIPKACATEHAAEAIARSCFEQGVVTWLQIQAILCALPEEPKLRWKQDTSSGMSRSSAKPKSFTSGAWARGPHYGLTRNLRTFPMVSKLLANVLQGVDASFQFSSCTLSRNVCSKPHRDSYNAVGSWNLVVPCSKFAGGEICVQDSEGCTFLSPQGSPGNLWDASSPTRFDPSLWHATAPLGGRQGHPHWLPGTARQQAIARG